MNKLDRAQVLILGLGISGLSMARWCVRHGAIVTVADTRENPPSLAALHAECPQATFVAGGFDDALLARAPWNLIAHSPGLPPSQLAPVQAWAQRHGAAWVGELDLFAQALQNLSQREVLPYKPQVLAITGTNGKTTVTSLTGLLLQRAGLRVAVAGNIGPALLDMLAAALDSEMRGNAEDAAKAAAEAAELAASEVATPVVVADPTPATPVEPSEADASDAQGELLPAEHETPPPLSDEDFETTDLIAAPTPAAQQPPHLPQAWVLELSSFQLDGTAGGAWDNRPTAATVLNITEDHLDWHGSMGAYIQAKAAVFGAQALMLLNREDPLVMDMQPANVTVKIGGRNRQRPARPFATFGLDEPARPGDWGLETVNGMTWLVRALALDETRQRGRKADEKEDIYFQRMMPADALRIRGRHNAANALAALALATSTGAPLAPMLHGLRDYRGEPHRVEPVGIVNEVEYFDDSKGTNVGATLAAVCGLGAERKLIVILGGDGKGQDFSPLAQALARYARALVLIGRDAARIREQLQTVMEAAGVPLQEAANLPEAVHAGAALAHPGDAVLLSPACASLDMFRNYQHRAEVFINTVRELAAAQGTEFEGAL